MFVRVTFDLGTRLKEARKTKGYTQQRVAKIIGISRPSISSYERNAVDPPLPILRSLADLYGVSVDYLLDMDKKEDDRRRMLSRLRDAGTAIEDVERLLRR